MKFLSLFFMYVLLIGGVFGQEDTVVFIHNEAHEANVINQIGHSTIGNATADKIVVKTEKGPVFFLINVFSEKRKKKKSSYTSSDKIKESNLVTLPILDKYDMALLMKENSYFLSLVVKSSPEITLIENTYLHSMSNLHLEDVDANFFSHRKIQFLNKKGEEYCCILLRKESSSINVYNEMLHHVTPTEDGSLAKVDALWEEYDGSRSGYINCNDSFVFKPVFKKIGLFNKCGNTYVQRDDYVPHYGIINVLGNEILPFTSSYKKIEQTTPSGYFIITKNDNVKMLLNPKGEIISEAISSFNETGTGNYYCIQEDKTIQFFNSKGDSISPNT